MDTNKTTTNWKNTFPKQGRFYETNNGILYCKDSLQILNEFPQESLDLILTDPPYNASREHKLVVANKHYKTIQEKWDKNFKVDFVKECVPLLKKGGQFQIFCSHHLLNTYLQEVPLQLRQILHYAKNNPFPGYRKVYGFSVQYILWFIKPGHPYTFNKDYIYSYKDIFFYNVSGWKITNHPTEKYPPIINALIATHSNEGDLVLDPYAGSGVVLVEAEKLNRKWIGIEINKDYCNMIKKRLSNIKKIGDEKR